MASILVLYHSQEHGNTGAMAEAVAEGARAAGSDVRMVNTNDQRLEIDAYRAVDAAAFGSPDYYSYLAGGLKVFLDDYHIAKGADAAGLTDKPYALFVGPLESLFERMGTKVGETAESRGAPDEAALAACRDLGRQLAEAAK